MRIVPLGLYPGVVMHVSDDVYQTHTLSIREDRVPETEVEDLLARDYESMLLERVDEKFLEFVRLYGKKHGRSGILVLDACGGMSTGKWGYEDAPFREPVQDWIDRNEENYAALVFMVGNEKGSSAKSKKALVFIPDAMIGKGGDYAINLREFHFTLRLPETGEEIDGYTIDSFLAELQK